MSNDTPSNDTSIGNSNVLPSDKMRTLSLDSVGPEKTQSSVGVFSKKKASLVTTVMLVWLESFEDHLNFPLSKITLNLFYFALRNEITVKSRNNTL